MNIIVISSQFIGNGGCSTLAYGLIKYLVNNNHKVLGLFVNPSKANVDPENIGNVLLIKQKISKWTCDEKLQTIISNFFGNMKNVNYVIYIDLSIEPLKLILPDAKYIFLISRSPLKYKHMTAVDVFNLSNHDDIIDTSSIDEINMTCADIIVPNSLLMKNMYNIVYPQYSHKLLNNVIDTSKYVYYLNSFNNKNTNINTEKTFDIILVSNRFDRKEKNFEHIFNILTDTIFDKFKKIIVGEINEKIIKFPECDFTGFTSHDKVIENMYKSKILIVPSLCESSGNVIREALMCNTIPLISVNVGFNERFPPDFVCETFDASEWKTKLLNLLNNYDELKNILKNINLDTGYDILDILYQKSIFTN